jgi:hypothetical protein
MIAAQSHQAQRRKVVVFYEIIELALPLGFAPVVRIRLIESTIVKIGRIEQFRLGWVSDHQLLFKRMAFQWNVIRWRKDIATNVKEAAVVAYRLTSTQNRIPNIASTRFAPSRSIRGRHVGGSG